MTWFTDPDIEAEVQLPHNVLVLAIDADFPDGHVRLSTWVASIVIAGNTFTAVGTLGSVSSHNETTQLVADTRSYRLSGCDPSLVPETEIDNCFGRSFFEYLAWIDPDDHSVVGYEINFEGRMDKVTRRDGGTQPYIEVNVEHRLVILDQSDGWCYTDEHQQQFYAGDHGLDQVRFNSNALQISWGGAGVSPGIVGSGYQNTFGIPAGRPPTGLPPTGGFGR